MAKDKYYDHLKPKLPPVSFSQAIEQQIQIVEQQRKARAASDMAMSKDRQKQLERQQKELLGFDVSNMSEVDKQVFANKRDWLKGRINNYYYTGNNTGQFIEDVNSLKNLHQELGNHYENVKGAQNNLEGWVTGTKQWTNKDLDLKDDINTFNQKRTMWEMSGIDPTSLRVDANGDTYGYYTDISGNRIKGQDGNPVYGLAAAAPTRGSQEYFSPTMAPYENLLPAKFAESFHKTLTKVRQDPNTNLAQKQEMLRSYVTQSAMGNPSVLATASLQLKENYGDEASASVLAKDKESAGDGYVPIDIREYVDEAMRYLPIEVIDKSKDGSGSGSSDDNVLFPSTSQFDVENFRYYHPPLLEGALVSDPEFGSGISSMLVPRAGVGGSTTIIPVSESPISDLDPRSKIAGDSYKLTGVAMDEGNRLFVNAQAKVNVPKNEFTPEAMERLRAAGVDISGEFIQQTKPISFVLEPSKGDEYLSILANLGYSAGAKKDNRRDAIIRGHELLQQFNEQQAQILAGI